VTSPKLLHPRMADRKTSTSSTNGGGPVMLERRVSNNRADLTGDQRMNYFLSWFQGWSDLQKSDFVGVLANKMSDGDIVDSVEALKINGDIINGDTKKPPSLYECQIKLFKDWFSSWSDDQKNYLVTRLQAIDAEFYEKYSLAEAKAPPVKDYFEPGVPPELVRKSSRSVLGPHAATFNAHQILPADQPKSFITSSLQNGGGSSIGSSCSGSEGGGGGGGSGGSSHNSSSVSTTEEGALTSAEGGEGDFKKDLSETDHTTDSDALLSNKHSSSNPAGHDNLATIVE